MALPAVTAYCTPEDVRDVLSLVGVDSRLDDDDDGAVTGDEERAFQKAISWASTYVRFRCGPRYADEELASSWLTNEWATLLAAYRLCYRRTNPVPDSLRRLIHGGDGEGKGVMGDLLDVQAGKAMLPDAGTRNVDWPAWSNLRVDPRYRLRQVRVERPISERTPTQYAQAVDWPAEGTFEQ